MPERLYGIRHHGPGSARSVVEALHELEPDLVVIEGAPELDGLVPLAGEPDLVPPVAALVYAVDAPRRASFYPLAAFSPEWVALSWAARAGVPVRHIDLPLANSLADRSEVAVGLGADTPRPRGQRAACRRNEPDP